MVSGTFNTLCDKWEIDLDELKCALEEIGGKPESVEYSLLATEALALSRCIIDIKTAFIEIQRNENGKEQKTKEEAVKTKKDN